MELPYKFELAGYCEGCPYFCEELESIDVTNLGYDEQRVMHTIRCSNRNVCARVTRVVNQVSK